MRIITLDQRSSHWHLWRAAGIGSSDAAKLVGLSPYGNARKVWEEKIAILDGKPPRHSPDNGAMARGRRLEPQVLAMYNTKYRARMQPVCALHQTLDWCRASLDGWDALLERAIEIKCPNADDHAQALAQQVPDKYWGQILHQLLVTGGDELHYVSYSNYAAPGKELAVVAVKRGEQEKALAALLDLEVEFWDWVTRRYWPETEEKKSKVR